MDSTAIGLRVRNMTTDEVGVIDTVYEEGDETLFAFRIKCNGFDKIIHNQKFEDYEFIDSSGEKNFNSNTGGSTDSNGYW